MDIRMKATITQPKGLLPLKLVLVKEEPKVFRWYTATSEELSYPEYEEAFTSETKAVSRLRFFVETLKSFEGCDLTIDPVAPPPEERAAAAIVEELLGFRTVQDVEKASDIIRQETNIGPLVDAVEKMVTHFFNVLGNTDPLAAGLMHAVVVELEKTKQVDLSSLKKVLSSPPKPRVDTTPRIIIPKVGRA